MPDRRDAESACKQALKGKPSFLVVRCTCQEEGHYQQKGRPKKEAPPDSTVWHVRAPISVDQQEVEVQIKKQASFIVATNVLDEQKLSNAQVYLTYKEQGGVERGFRFLKDPLFLASSIFLKKPERVMALSFIMVLCLLVYRLAEHVLRRQLAIASQTVPNQLNKPTDRPTMRWIASRALRGLTFSTFVWDHDGKPRSWGCNPFINVFSVCLALPFVKSIFCLRKLRNVGSNIFGTASALV